ncbi:MAG: hypothetical protein ACLP19_05855 [Xanthobacteraceae bacterium]
MTRVEELEAENFRLRAMLAKAGVVLPPPVDLPTDLELDLLIARVTEKYRVLWWPDDAQTFRDQFKRAIEFFAHAQRSDKVNTSYATSFWLDACKSWLDGQGRPRDMMFAPFVAAAICSGILYEPFDQPSVCNLGLQLGGAGRPSSAWRNSLKQIPEPSEPMRPRPSARLIQTNIVESMR